MVWRWVFRGIAAVCVFLILSLSIKALLPFLEPKPHEQPTYQPSCQADVEVGVVDILRPKAWFADTVADPSAFWTALACLIAILALVGLREQLVLTAHATEQTKRSVDAFINAERGRITVVRCWRPRGDLWHTHVQYMVRNSGRSAVNILEYGSSVQAVRDISDYAPEEIPLVAVSFVAEPRVVFGFMEHGDITIQSNPGVITFEYKPENDGLDLIVAIKMHFRTNMGMYVFQETFLVTDSDFLSYGGAPYTLDERLLDA